MKLLILVSQQQTDERLVENIVENNKTCRSQAEWNSTLFIFLIILGAIVFVCGIWLLFRWLVRNNKVKKVLTAWFKIRKFKIWVYYIQVNKEIEIINKLKSKEEKPKIGQTFMDENSMMTYSLQSFQVRGFGGFDKTTNENHGFSKYQNQKGKKGDEELKLSRSKLIVSYFQILSLI
jgi:hypothetical protein